MSQDTIVYQRLYEVMDDSALSLVEKQRRGLALGREFLGVEHSHIQRRNDDSTTDTVVASDGNNPDLTEGVTLDRATTYCRRVIDTNGPVALTDASEEGWADDPAYQEHGLDCYLGTTIFVHDDVYGTVCFSSRDARGSSFTSEEKAVVELLARLLGREIESAHHEHHVTETQQARKRAENKYETLLQQAPDAVFLADADTANISEVNERAADLTGYAQSDLKEMSVIDLHPPEERDRYAELFGTDFSDGPRDRFADGTPLYIRRADGTDCPIEMSVTSVDIDGQEFVQGIVRDISTRREREQELARTTEFLKQTQEAANLGGWEYDLRSETLRWSDEVCRIHGLPPEYEPTVSEGLDFYHPDDQSIISDAFEELTTEGEPYDLELRLLTADDTVRWVRVIGRPVYAEDEEIVAARGVFQDISGRKERERDLRIKSQALEESTVGITIANADQPDLPIVYANEGFTRLTGYPKQRLLGDNCRFLQGEETDEATVTEIREAIESDTPIRTEILNYRADGTPFWNQLTIAPVTGTEDEDVTHYVGIQDDITAKKRRDELIGVLNRVLRHNLRNDMGVIIGFADMIAERTEGETAQMARQISEKSTELSALSEKAQALQKAVQSSEQLAPRDVQADVEATVAELRTEFPETEFSIETAPCEDVMATETLRLVLRELGENAAKYGDSSGVTYGIEMTEDGEVAIHIQDGGPGLPEMERHVLEVGRETPLRHGSGLGLWMVNWIVTGLGGEVTTTVDDGTTVTVRLAPAAEGAVPEHRDAALSTQGE
ncbi:PAS domain S-box protein [Halobellus ordinarius]|uniref:PAS domain S-box protein n=1 Tax=Halobellus ordinarius TaxID=3075120 RepID=UPI0028804394|nr:PAS domain S-box protein [Halobellus sp. ZY16]